MLNLPAKMLEEMFAENRLNRNRSRYGNKYAKHHSVSVDNEAILLLTGFSLQ